MDQRKVNPDFEFKHSVIHEKLLLLKVSYRLEIRLIHNI